MASRPAFDPDHPAQVWVTLETYSTVTRERDQLREQLAASHVVNSEIAPLKARIAQLEETQVKLAQRIGRAAWALAQAQEHLATAEAMNGRKA
jgi:hypothetical protein